jgi:hypothetical protein
LQLCKNVEVGVGISGDVLLDECHADVEAAYAVRVVSRFDDTHQFLIDHYGG